MQSKMGHAALFQRNEKSPEYIFVTEKTRAFLDSVGAN
jgi:hypothetical protein